MVDQRCIRYDIYAKFMTRYSYHSNTANGCTLWSQTGKSWVAKYSLNPRCCYQSWWVNHGHSSTPRRIPSNGHHSWTQSFCYASARLRPAEKNTPATGLSTLPKSDESSKGSSAPVYTSPQTMSGVASNKRFNICQTENVPVNNVLTRATSCQHHVIRPTFKSVFNADPKSSKR